MTNNLSIFNAIYTANSIDLPATVTNIAEMTGLPPQHVSYVLSKHTDLNILSVISYGFPEDLANYDSGRRYDFNIDNLEIAAIMNGKAWSIDQINCRYIIYGIEDMNHDDFRSLIYFFSNDMQQATNEGPLTVSWSYGFGQKNTLTLALFGTGPGQGFTAANNIFQAYMNNFFPDYIDINSNVMSLSEKLNYFKSFWEE